MKGKLKKTKNRKAGNGTSRNLNLWSQFGGGVGVGEKKTKKYTEKNVTGEAIYTGLNTVLDSRQWNQHTKLSLLMLSLKLISLILGYFFNTIIIQWFSNPLPECLVRSRVFKQSSPQEGLENVFICCVRCAGRKTCRTALLQDWESLLLYWFLHPRINDALLVSIGSFYVKSEQIQENGGSTASMCLYYVFFLTVN